MAERYDAKGPFVTWIHRGSDGWVPRSTDSLAEALAVEGYGSTKAVTRIIEWTAVENPSAEPVAGEVARK